jgi:two-component system, NarL family, response regulator DevR
LDTLRVYVVDDSALLRQRLLGLLAELDRVEVIGEAEDRDQAIIEVTKLKPHVVILDIQLRESNGIEVLTQIKQVQPSPTLIMLTNYPYPQFREKSMSAGADYFFYKATELAGVTRAFTTVIAHPLSAQENDVMPGQAMERRSAVQ